MKRTFLAAVVLLAATACSSSGKTAAPGVQSAAASVSPTADQKTRILECGGFDIGVAYLNDAWPQLVAGTVPAGYADNMSKASAEWETVLSDSPVDTLADSIDRAAAAVDDMRKQISNAAPGETVQLGPWTDQLYSAWEDVHVACETAGYNLTQTLVPANG